MGKFKKCAKCVRCCPDGGAIFRAVFSEHGSEWECNNCQNRIPRREYKPVPRITPSQQEVINLLSGMGWTVKTQFVGRSVWITGECENKWYDGNKFYGKISPVGKFSLTATSFGNPPKITDRIGISVYLEVK